MKDLIADRPDLFNLKLSRRPNNLALIARLSTASWVKDGGDHLDETGGTPLLYLAHLAVKAGKVRFMVIHLERCPAVCHVADTLLFFRTDSESHLATAGPRRSQKTVRDQLQHCPPRVYFTYLIHNLVPNALDLLWCAVAVDQRVHERAMRLQPRYDRSWLDAFVPWRLNTASQIDKRRLLGDHAQMTAHKPTSSANPSGSLSKTMKYCANHQVILFHPSISIPIGTASAA